MYRKSEDDSVTTEVTVSRLRQTLEKQLVREYGQEVADHCLDEILKINGIHADNFNFLKTVDTLVGLGKKLNDISIDDNANKQAKHFGASIQESINPVKKAIGYDYLYRQLKEDYGKDEAIRLTGRMLDYSLAIGDSASITTQYSYYGMTPVIISINGKSMVISLRDLFEVYKKDAKVVGENAWSIDAKSLKHSIEFVCMNARLHTFKVAKNYHKACEDVSEDVDIKVWDTTNGWVDLLAITKHQSNTGMTIYQTENGDYAFVTDNHPVIMADGSNKYASELQIGDEILKEEGLPEFKEFINVPEKIAYILGFIAGDGYCKLGECVDGWKFSPTGQVKMFSTESMFHITQLDVDSCKAVKYVQDMFGESHLWNENFIGKNKSNISKQFCSQWLSEICTEYFGYHKNANAHTKNLPINIMNWKKEAKEAFVAGLIDSDGTLYNEDGRVDIRMKAYGLSVALYDLLRTIDGVKGLHKRVTFLKRYGNAGGEKGTDAYNANGMMFGTAFKPSRGMRKHCEKLQKFSDEEFEAKCMSFNENSCGKRDNTIKKILRFDKEQILTEKFKNELENVYDITTSTGRFYANGMVQHNCWSFNASIYVLEGKNFGGYRSLPPKTVGDYIGGLSEIVHEFSANLAGALAIGTFCFDVAHILLYEEKVDLRELKSSSWLRKNLASEYKQFIRSVNNLSRNGIESPFTNISIFDRPKVRKMLDEFSWYFPFDDLPINKPASVESEDALNKYYIDFLTEYVMQIQDIYLDVFDAGDEMHNGAPLKFPVVTTNLAIPEDGEAKIVDGEFLKDICNRQIFRYNVFVSKGSKIASCCFRGDQKISAKFNGDSEFGLESLESLYGKTHGENEVTSIVVKSAEGKEVKAHVVKLIYDKPFISIAFEDGTKFVTTDNHKNAYCVSEHHYADIDSSDVEVGIKFFSAEKEGGVKVVDVNRNIPNMDKSAYCIEIEDKDATHFIMPNGIVTHNCRLINDMEMMNLASQVNSFGAGGSVSIGSSRVITQNLIRTAIMATSKDDFYRRIAENMDDSAKILASHKRLLRELEKQGYQPFITAGWIDLDRSFGTFGIIGTYETAEIFRSKFGNGEDTEGNLLRFINTQMELVSKKHGVIGNIEQIPGESMAHRLCNVDKMLFPENEYIGDSKLYSNAIVPAWLDVSMWDRLDKDGRYNHLITGGGIVHINVGEKITPSQTERLIRYATTAGCEHFAVNPIFSICEDEHVSIGKLDTCPICGKKINDFLTRVIGYFTRVSNMGYARRTYDFPTRKVLDVNSKPTKK